MGYHPNSQVQEANKIMKYNYYYLNMKTFFLWVCVCVCVYTRMKYFPGPEQSRAVLNQSDTDKAIIGPIFKIPIISVIH